MREPRFRLGQGRLLELLALALETAQHGVDETARAADAEQRRRIDRGRHRRVLRDPQRLELQQPHAQQCRQRGLLAFERPREQSLHLPLETKVPTQRTEYEGRK